MAEKEYIERGAVLNAISALAIRITPIEENRDRFYHDSGWNGASVGARVEVWKTTAADVVEVRHGYWYIVEYEYLNCSECGESYYTGADSTREARERLAEGEYYPYCPHCGAKMDGERENVGT